ncbi:MAG: hypothetical protein IFK94_12010 [Acidobacteria bacterium]|uniref:SGNH hydrolase-type esterase domain-containing protein n=1 Tax=Candidatus Polarisedimenticola svalbardensis TaxID=2886004 RepID=A0A8J6XUN9_9BACT|nr:hypothetical protein [Candidatus Polarisedimenticola svalbardensis]
MIRRIVLAGASVGRDWDFPGFPERTGLTDIQCEYCGRFDFDKKPLLDRLLQPGQPVPDAVLLKECAAYFPGDHQGYTAMMEEWVDRCMQAGAVPVLVTVAPVVRRTGKLRWLKELAARLQGRRTVTGRLAAISRFNDWLRELASLRGLALLDLEEALRVGPHDRSLRPDLHSGDGLHLNEGAYSLLDEAMGRLVRSGLAPVRTEEA